MVNNVIGMVNYVIAARPSLLNFVIADSAEGPLPGPSTVGDGLARRRRRSPRAPAAPQPVPAALPADLSLADTCEPAGMPSQPDLAAAEPGRSDPPQAEPAGLANPSPRSQVGSRRPANWYGPADAHACARRRRAILVSCLVVVASGAVGATIWWPHSVPQRPVASVRSYRFSPRLFPDGLRVDRRWVLSGPGCSARPWP